MPAPLPPLPLRLVLLRPRFPENVGAVARAMKNFSLTRCTLVEPQVVDWEGARRMAVQAGELLDSMERADSLEEAVADCVWVVGTSSRHVEGKQRISPEALATEAVRRAATGPVAIVFGDERSGMTNAEVQRCGALSSIPTSTDQPSVNLAQAALLYGYELQRARLAARERPAPLRPKPATDQQLSMVQASLEALLTRGGFLSQPQRHAVRDLMGPLSRSELTAKEAALWTAALKAVSKRLPDPGLT